MQNVLLYDRNSGNYTNVCNLFVSGIHDIIYEQTTLNKQLKQKKDTYNGRDSLTPILLDDKCFNWIANSLYQSITQS